MDLHNYGRKLNLSMQRNRINDTNTRLSGQPFHRMCNNLSVGDTSFYAYILPPIAYGLRFCIPPFNSFRRYACGIFVFSSLLGFNVYPRLDCYTSVSSYN